MLQSLLSTAQQPAVLQLTFREQAWEELGSVSPADFVAEFGSTRDNKNA